LENLPAPGEGEGEGGGEGGGEEAGGEEGGGGLFAGDEKEGALLAALPGAENMKHEADLDEEEDEIEKPSIDDEDAPAKAEKQIRNVFNEPIKKSRKVTRGPASTHMPDFKSMTGVGRTTRGQDTLNKPFDDDFIKSPFRESSVFSDTTSWDYIDSKITQHAKMTNEMESTLKKLRSNINIPRKGMILESSPALDDEIIELQIDEEGNLIEDGKSAQ